MNIFAEKAPAHWAAGLPVMPLQARDKRPVLMNWSKFCAIMPTAEEQGAWLAEYPSGNMGLPLGPCSGLVGIDVDTEDPRVADLVSKVCGYSPWTRRGKKGSVKIYLYSGERTFRIKDNNNNTILECLSQGAQIVLPPSIHPDTQMPYVADADLPVAMQSAVRLPDGVEVLLRQGLIDLGFELATQGQTKVSHWVPAGSRDTQMTAMAGILSRGVVKGQRTLAEAMNEIENWVANFTEKVAGDVLDPKTARDKVVSFFIRDCTGPRGAAVAPGWEDGLPEELIKEIKELLGEEGEAWDFARFQAHAVQLATQFEPNTANYLQGVSALVTKIVNASAMSPLEEEGLLRLVANLSKRTITVPMLKVQLREQRAGDLDGVDHTEIAEALIEELRKVGSVRYHLTQWWQYNGAYWHQLEESTILRKIAENFGHYPAARKHSDHKGIMATAANMVTGELKLMMVDGINFANGFLTTDQKFVAHNEDFGKTYVMGYRYMPDQAGNMPRFRQYLYDCWGDEPDFDDRVQCVREAMAATMFGIGWKFQRAICCFGVAGTGKSVMLDIVQGLMPDGAVCSVKPGDWDDTFLPSQMYGKLMNRAGELSDTKMIPGDMFKMIVEGSTISAQLKHKPIFTFKPTLTHWFGSNHPPRSRDSSNGFTRRWLFLVFSRVVDEKMKNNDLAAEILSEECEAIMAWAAGAVPALMARSEYTLPASHLAQARTVGATNNSARQFLQSSTALRICRDDGAKITETDLYDLYYTFCTAVTNAKPVNLSGFRHRMQEMAGEFGFKIDSQNNAAGYEETHYLGIMKAKK